MREIGCRIGAVLEADDNTISLIGFGVYAGEEVPPANVSPMLHEIGLKNPKLIMDDGQIAWGCECWWGNEEKVKQIIGGRKIVMVDMTAKRQRGAEVL